MPIARGPKTCFVSREMLKDWEERTLYEHALKNSTFSPITDRAFQEKPHRYRSEFQRDRDRILHSCSFRKLMHKAQIFISPDSEEYRTRLTHTLEVMQIARTIARALNLNEDATEAIALGHDLGHVPFGHQGESELRKCVKRYAKDSKNLLDHGFEHNEQSVRIVEQIDSFKKPPSKNFGLNLTRQVREGILRHTEYSRTDYPEDRETSYPILMKSPYPSLEAQVVDISDGLAYLNHDIQNTLQYGILKRSDFPKGVMRRLAAMHPGKRIDVLVNDVIKTSSKKLRKSVGIYDFTRPLITYSERYHDIIENKELKGTFRDLFSEKVYKHPLLKRKAIAAQRCIRFLFKFYYEIYLAYPDKLPDYARVEQKRRGLSSHEISVIASCDRISFISDSEANDLFNRINSPESGRGKEILVEEFPPKYAGYGKDVSRETRKRR